MEEYYSAMKKNKIMSFAELEGKEDLDVKENKPDSRRQLSHVFSDRRNKDLKRGY
jgi:hypothetical protein